MGCHRHPMAEERGIIIIIIINIAASSNVGVQAHQPSANKPWREVSSESVKDWQKYELTSWLGASLPNLIGCSGQTDRTMKMSLSHFCAASSDDTLCQFWWESDEICDLWKLWKVLTKSKMAVEFLRWRENLCKILKGDNPQYQQTENLLLNPHTSVEISKNAILRHLVAKWHQISCAYCGRTPEASDQIWSSEVKACPKY